MDNPFANLGPSDLSLRYFNLSDADDIMTWAADERVTRFCRWEKYNFREQAIDYIKSMATHPYIRAICLKNMAIGAISVTSNSGYDRCRGELGFVLASGYWGKGIMTHAVKLVISAIFKEWPHLERLEAVVDVENKASQRVLEKAEFIREGILRKYIILKGVTRDVVMYSLLKSDVEGEVIPMDWSLMVSICPKPLECKELN